MSASTEQLVEQIKATEAAIVVAEGGGKDVTVLKADLRQLQRRLHVATEALTEGKHVLKG
jgi:hypothetical protein